MYELILLVLGIAFVASHRGTRARIMALEADIRKLSDQVAALQQPSAPAPVQTTEAAAQVLDTPPSAEAETAALQPSEVTGEALGETESPIAAPVAAMAESAETEKVQEPAPLTTSPTAAPAESLESYLGARWAVWAGGLALALGGLFLVRYSIESGLLGPGVRLTLAALFGLALTAVGEALRRRVVPGISGIYANAMIPGVLTSAGVISVFGAVYAAHGIYGFIGSTPAFLMLALTAFATLGLSLLHGQGLAGVGLLGSMVTPLLVSSNAPSPWTLFGFLTISHLATIAASRRQRWLVVPAFANLGMGGWATVYLLSSFQPELTPAVLALLAMLASATFLWPARAFEAEERTSDLSEVGFALVLGRAPALVSVTLALATVIPALGLLAQGFGLDVNPAYAMAALLAALGAIGASRHAMVWPAILSALAAVVGIALQVSVVGTVLSLLDNSFDAAVLVSAVDSHILTIALGLGVFFVAAGFAFILRKGGQDPVFATLWAAIVATAPLALGCLTYVGYGDFTQDWTHGLYGLLLAVALLAGAEGMARAGLRTRLPLALDMLVAGSFLSLMLALEALATGLTQTLLIAFAGFAYVMATRLRDWRALPWMMVVACISVLARIAWEPTIVGPLALGKTPVFNALLPGYGLPALLAILSVYVLRPWPSTRVRSMLEALAILMGLLAVAILVRHAMNGGVLTDSIPTLGEQSIYTLLIIGLPGVLMTLDVREPRPVFRYGSMLLGAISMFNVLTLHLGELNPFVSGENTGPWPFFNLLLIGYLLPGIAYAILAWYARDKRPRLYVTLLALTGAVLGFAWATLSVRRFWQGENIVYWKGFLQGETYSYSVAWLIIGVGLLALGSRFDAKSIRLASAVVVLIAVAKAFLIDMSNLEGVLRALSFIGLGVVLIGIGLFYQKILTRGSGKETSRAADPVAENS
ncbi:DUF2339 domain-containing protein [Rhizobium sp. RU36D]|uniref:DUF2339 domain-containing protein n=1 Tax=Rhizobium sp. RU36D TaxID=1907415 RepID=UPI0009D86E4B|nr:DUF2339 domain-containing protein [Rhizobium sp. RU36D]SMD07653.1 Uncharacterized membrane protein [Rhizobium sp. RU36D]